MKNLRIIWALVAMVLFGASNVWALTKPIDVKDYNLTYQGIGSGSLNYINGTLYLDNQDGGLYCQCGQGEGSGGHPAVDIPCGINTPVRAIASGTVVEAHFDGRGFGKTVVIQHDSDDITSLAYPQDVVYSCYSHLNSYSVNQGDHVDDGQVIAASGNTGPSTYHLHFQIDRHRRLDTGEIVSMVNTDISSNNHPYLPYPYAVNEVDVNHDRENYTINPMPFLQMNEYDPCFVPVGFVLNADYSGHPHWDASGISQEFRDAYDDFFEENGTALGFPWDNAPSWISYGQAVHRIEEAGGMWIQDLYGPHNGLSHPHSALIQGNSSTDPVRILKEGFWDYWMHNVGWESFGKPVNDEYLVNGVWHQTFRKPDRAYVFSWANGSVEIDSLFGPVAVMRNVGFVNSGATRTEGDGIYHSGLWATGFNDPVELIDGILYDGFMAMVSGEEIPIAPFTVNGDMTVYVGGEPDVQFAQWNVWPNPGVIDQYFHVQGGIINNGTGGTVIPEVRVTLTDPSGQEVYSLSSYDVDLDPDDDWYMLMQITPQVPGNYTARMRGFVDGQWQTYDTETVYVQHQVPVASFSRTPASGTVPLSVQFTDQSSNNPNAWLWNFGDGSTSTSRHPSHTYNSTGNFNVSLTASNSAGSDSETWNNCVTVSPAGQAPGAYFVMNQNLGYVPFVVQFTDQSIHNPTSWLWNFGDGSTSINQNPSHTYQTPGLYSVSLTVSNAYGSDIFTRQNSVRVGVTPPVVDFTADVTSGIVPLTVQFTDQTTGNPTTWIWDFGDGDSNTGDQNPSHTYVAPGVYSVYLWASDDISEDELLQEAYITVTDGGGCSGEDAYYFNGVDQGLSTYIGQGLYGDQGSLELWMILEAHGDNNLILYNDWDYNPNKLISLFVTEDDIVQFERGSADAQPSNRVLSNEPLSYNRWYHIVATWQQGLPSSLYINGQLNAVATEAMLDPNNEASYNGAEIGYSNYHGVLDSYFRGMIDEVRLSSIARSSEEVVGHYISRSEFVVDEHTVALWHMNGSSGTVTKRDNAQGDSSLDLVEHNDPGASAGFNECFALDVPQLSITYLDEEIVLEWNDISGANSYRVYGAQNGGVYNLLAESVESQQVITGTMLDPGNVWIFRVIVVR